MAPARVGFLMSAAAATACVGLGLHTAAAPRPPLDRPQYICVNNNQGWHPNDPASFTQASVDAVLTAVNGTRGSADGRTRLCLSFDFWVLRDGYHEENASLPEAPDIPRMVRSAEALLALSLANDLPVSLSIDATQWWTARPDLWQWWDATAPGYNSTNRLNVEWTGWNAATDATSLSWRNWGSQFRMPTPPPNFASPAFRDAAAETMTPIAAAVRQWYEALPRDKKYLLAYVRCTQELWMGTNYYVYPNSTLANGSAAWPPSHDPKTGPAGSAQLGYAALCTSGKQCSGRVTRAGLDWVRMPCAARIYVYSTYLCTLYCAAHSVHVRVLHLSMCAAPSYVCCTCTCACYARRTHLRTPHMSAPICMSSPHKCCVCQELCTGTTIDCRCLFCCALLWVYVQVVSDFVAFAGGVLADAGIPRSRRMSHTGVPWYDVPNTSMSWNGPSAAVTAAAAPGWSLYLHSTNASSNPGLSEVLANSMEGTPWGAPEWLRTFDNSGSAELWAAAFAGTLTYRNNRLIVVQNFNSIQHNPGALAALVGVLQVSPLSACFVDAPTSLAAAPQNSSSWVLSWAMTSSAADVATTVVDVAVASQPLLPSGRLASPLATLTQRGGQAAAGDVTFHVPDGALPPFYFTVLSFGCGQLPASSAQAAVSDAGCFGRGC